MNDAGFRLDALLPAEIAARVVDLGVRKAALSPAKTLVLAILAGGFVSVGCLFATVSVAGAADVLPYGLQRIIFGLTFCLALILIMLGGAELFTGNTLITMAWASRRVSTRALLRNWVLVYTGNLIGTVITALVIALAGQHRFGDGSVGVVALSIAEHKTALPFMQALLLAIMGNAMVCSAIWLTVGAHTTADKILAVLFPITGFAAAGFEHSIANLYFIPSALFIRTLDPAFAAATGIDQTTITLAGFINNLIPVTIGNIIGGVVLVGGVYWWAYLRGKASPPG